MEEGLDLFRSVWDRDATLAVWDVEYFNLDTWAGLYGDQIAYFELMEPTYRLIEELLDGYGIPHLNDTTASGYHFVSRIPFSSPVHARLEAIGAPERSLMEKYAVVPGGDNKRTRPLPERDARGYSAIGRLTEFLCHRVIERSAGRGPLPVMISDVASARTPRGREGMNLDITQYADPLFMRDIRTSFSTHQKHKVYVGRIGQELARRLPVYATVPRGTLSSKELLEIRRDLDRAAEYAGAVSSAIPDAAAGWGRVIEDYLASPLYRFHRDFDAVEHEPAERWPETYWRLDLGGIPLRRAGGAQLLLGARDADEHPDGLPDLDEHRLAPEAHRRAHPLALRAAARLGHRLVEVPRGDAGELLGAGLLRPHRDGARFARGFQLRLAAGEGLLPLPLVRLQPRG